MEIQNKIDLEYQEALKDFKPEFGNTDHLRVIEIKKELAKNEKMKRTRTAIKNNIELKRETIWLMQLDF